MDCHPDVSRTARRRSRHQVKRRSDDFIADYRLWRLLSEMLTEPDGHLLLVTFPGYSSCECMPSFSCYLKAVSETRSCCKVGTNSSLDSLSLYWMFRNATIIHEVLSLIVLSISCDLSNRVQVHLYGLFESLFACQDARYRSEYRQVARSPPAGGWSADEVKCRESLHGIKIEVGGVERSRSGDSGVAQHRRSYDTVMRAGQVADKSTEMSRRETAQQDQRQENPPSPTTITAVTCGVYVRRGVLIIGLQPRLGLRTSLPRQCRADSSQLSIMVAFLDPVPQASTVHIKLNNQLV
ncbi:hypothetical protein J6590_064723 [Homalodisca vitripennis]|nr:hypothetical protein J6590_064723 [Homalodisca vitripennis]